MGNISSLHTCISWIFQLNFLKNEILNQNALLYIFNLILQME